ncbi:8-oxoguanine glycosylase ogg1, partial [Rhizoclosmatium hyalinum]
MPPSPWQPLCPTTQLKLSTTLFNGQAFTWRQTGPHHFSNVFLSTLVTLRQRPTDPHVLFRIEHPTLFLSANSDSIQAFLSNYFLLHVNADALIAKWTEADPSFSDRTAHLAGIRLLRQPPVECTFAFICSANNNISRITGMVNNLKREYGTCVGRVHAESLDKDPTGTDEPFCSGEDFFTFPEPEDMCSDNVEPRLRELGFGYRAAYIAKSALMLQEKEGGGSAWLHSLRDMEYEVAKTHILELWGVGPKVADCILLMSLDKFNAIPVDTHVWRIAQRDYGLSKSAVTKSLSAKTYKAIGDKWREIFGEYAGWAQSLLFSAEISIGNGMKKVSPKKEGSNIKEEPEDST